MNILYVLSGFACLAFGTWLTIKQIKTFRKNEQDDLGFDIKLFGGGLMAIVLGIALITHYIPLL
jgi:hypothetical protein